MTGSLRAVALIEDDPTYAALVQDWLQREGLAPEALRIFGTLGAAIAALQEQPADVVLLDLNLPDSHALPTLQRLLERWPWLAIVILTGLEDEDLALQAVELGAEDFIGKTHLTQGAALLSRLTQAYQRRVDKYRLFTELSGIGQRLREPGHEGSP